MTALRGEPGRPLLDNLPHPMEGLHVVFEGGAAKQPDLRHIGWTQPGLATLSLDGFDHRGFLATDIGAGATPKINRRNLAGRIFLKLSDLTLQDRPATVILIAEVNINRVYADRPCRNQRAFEKTVWVTLQVVPVLEGARLAHVDVNRHQPRSRFGRNQFPFATCREACTTKAAQARVFHERDDIGGLPLSCDTGCGESITARRAIGGVRSMARSDGRVDARVSHSAGVHGSRYELDSCLRNRILTDHRHRCSFAAPYTR